MTKQTISPLKAKANAGRIFVLGRKGQLAHCLNLAAQARNLDMVCAGREECDIIQLDQIAAFLNRIRPCLVINAAAFTAVDLAETEIEKAFAINAKGPENIATACARDDIPLIHISTDYVFDGQKTLPYTEDDATAPLGVYGQSKLEGEKAISCVWQKHVILRTSWVYCEFGRNFLRTMLRFSGMQKEVSVVNDQKGCPTDAMGLADVICDIAEKISDGVNEWGIYNACGVRATTWHGFAQDIFFEARKLGQKTPNVKAIASNQYLTPAMRPKNSILDCGKLQNTWGTKVSGYKVRLASAVSAALER